MLLILTVDLLEIGIPDRFKETQKLAIIDGGRIFVY